MTNGTAQTALEQAQQRLDQIADLLAPCEAPDVAGGIDRCCGRGNWPCDATRAAWIAHGVDEAQERKAASAEWRSRLIEKVVARGRELAGAR